VTTSQTPREPRGCLPTVLIGVLMFAIVAAGVFTADALSERDPVPVTVGAGVTIAPSLAWQFVTRIEAPTGEQDGIVLTRGSGNLLVYTSPAPVADALAELRTELLGSPLMSVGEFDQMTFGPGDRSGLRFAFSGAMPELAAAPVEGEGYAVQGSEVSLLMLGWAGTGDFRLLRDELAAMISGATIP
jgi:hypothetical protein